MAKTGYLVLAATLLAACSSEAPQPTAPLSLPVVTQAVHAPGDGNGGNFGTPLSGQPLSALLADIQNGNAYVNAHTDDGVAPSNTGPGDYPGGEVRGQVEHRGH